MHSLSLFRLFTHSMFVAVLLLTGLYQGMAVAASSGGVIYFHRPAGFNGAFKRPAVIIDGKTVGTIGSGECHAIRLPAGHHKIFVRDQTSLLSRFGLELTTARVNVWNGGEIFITVRPLQDPYEFNESSPNYDMLVSSRGQRC